MSDILKIFGKTYSNVEGIKAYDSNGTLLTFTRGGGSPTLQSKTDINPTTSSQTITADTGYDGLSSVQINAMPSGTEGTPTATKGTISNHQVSVTPSVTNTAGYISGSTKTGTAVTVTASELASGNKEITANGTNIDVVGYSTASVAVPNSVVVTDTSNTTGTSAAITADSVDTLITKTITQNGTYTASTDSADGYSSVTVNVSGGSPSVTQHTIHLEFSDSTDTDISVYYNDSLIGAMITAYEPSSWTYNNKTVIVAELDGTEWYNSSITWETLFSGTQVINENANGNYIYISQDTPISITQNSLWRITWNGTERIHTPMYEQYNEWISDYCIDGQNDGTNALYKIWSQYDAWIIPVGNETGSVVLKIERAVTT